MASDHTDPADWAGTTPKDLTGPDGVPGIQRAAPVPTSTALGKWLTTGHRPPASHTVARPEGADPAVLLTDDCRLDK